MTANNKKRTASVPAAPIPRKKLKENAGPSKAVVTDGIVLTFGTGDVGQLGLGTKFMERKKPYIVTVKPSGKKECPLSAVQIWAGGMHSIVCTEKGEVFTWGCNDEGALGRATVDSDDVDDSVADDDSDEKMADADTNVADDTNDEQMPGLENVPRPVLLQYHVVQVTAGDSHSAALVRGGRVFLWGTFRDNNGPFGLTPDGEKSALPQEINCEELIRKIASGNDHLVCLSDKGDLFTLGCAEQGQLGRVPEMFSTRGGRRGLSRILIAGLVRCKERRKLVKFDEVWTGHYATYARDVNGNIFAFGLNNYHQLGFDDVLVQFLPRMVTSFDASKGWKEIWGGQHHTLALDKNGKVYSLGRADYGRLGLGEPANDEERKDPKCHSAPQLVPALANQRCVHVSCGSAVSFAVDSDGVAYSWGMGSTLQLGLEVGQGEESEDCWEPKPITGANLKERKVLDVSGGGQHTMMLVTNAE